MAKPSIQSLATSRSLPKWEHSTRGRSAGPSLSSLVFLTILGTLLLAPLTLGPAALAQVPAESESGGPDTSRLRDLLQRLRRGNSVAVDPVEFQTSAIVKLQRVSDSIRRCVDGLQGLGGASAVLQALREHPGRDHLAEPEVVSALQKAAGSGVTLKQADLEVCAHAVDTHALVAPRSDPGVRLTEVDQSLGRCVAALQRVGPNATVTNILRRSGRKLGETTYTTPADLRALEGAVGPLGLTPQDLEFCAASYGTQVVQELRVASVSRAATNDVGQCGDDPYCCPAGQFACFGTSVFPTCCPSGSSYCSQSCSDGDCAPWCESSCFPGEATVSLEGGGLKPMREVQVGDRVRVLHGDGSIGYEDVYLLTHKDATSASRYITVTLAAGAKLTLSPRHFIPTATDPSAPDWRQRVVKGADEIRPGDVVWFEEDGRTQAAEVTAVASTLELGAYNPLTPSGTIIVDGVVASAHSDWFLDGIVSADLQAKVYQAVLAPVRLAYRVIGPAWTREISETWGVADAVRNATTRPNVTWLAWLVPLLVFPLAGAMLLRRRRAMR